MAADSQTPPGGGPAATEKRAFAIRRVYTKDISFESPNAPQVFSQEQWAPDVSVSLSNQAILLGNDLHEVTLAITVTAKLADKIAYLVEVQQAGEFQTTGFNGNDLRELLGIYCPGLLFPFLREVVANLVTKGGFPPLLLAPVNFDLLYQQHMKALQEQQGRQSTAN
jgi:preprotein translocase subunit SecB